MAARDQLLRRMLRERFIVTLRTGEAFDGLLIDVDEKTLRLGNAVVVAANGRHTPVDGELYVPRTEVIYLQRSVS